MKKRIQLPLKAKAMVALAFIMLHGVMVTAPVFGQSADAMIRDYVQAYADDPMAMNAYFGIKVEEDWWTVKVERNERGYLVGKSQKYTFHEMGPHNVSVEKGKPSRPTWYFHCPDMSTLRSLYTNELTAGTASMRTRESDPQPLFGVADMEGFSSGQGETALAYLTMEHFWKKGNGEVTPFGRDKSMETHGAMMVSLYTMKDKRIGWFSLGQMEVANAEEDIQSSQVPNLFIITSGKGKAVVNGEEMDIDKGMSFFVPPYIQHKLYNPYEEPLEGVLVLFGDNIDYVWGQSYIGFLEQEYAFYQENETRVKQGNKK
ncbi:cupin domain-containing protein [Roseivirga thermotolerans]|uniref:cupin domain-containing protein n=1 Tax=Roseivirga thermotolerans TaxID=1758176 RepID=UPI00273F9710|nr:cupin domain-containing protein [Roseivirga thermotolerans]